MHSWNSSKSGSDIDEADDIEMDWDDGPGFDSISRVDRLGGGATIYVKNDYHAVHRNDLEVLGVECVWVEIKISKNHPVLH
jgi:hypothetical protein